MKKRCPNCKEETIKIGEFKVPATLPIPIIDIPSVAKGEPLELYGCPNCGLVAMWGSPEVVRKVKEEE